MPACSFYDRVNGDTIISAYERMGYPFFTNGDYNINLFGVRSSDDTANTFNDLIGLFYTVGGDWILNKYDATTDPGLYYRQNPMNVDGTAILCNGYIPKAFRIGLHKGKPALQQNVPFQVWRDTNRDNILDWNDKSETHSGMYAINLHRAGLNSTQVDKWSAACQVIAADADMRELLDICSTAAQKFGPVFSYALFTEQEFFG